METLWHDLRYGFRILRKSPGFTAVAVLTLALGIGANTAVFSVVDAFAFRPLPVKNPERLVYIYTSEKTSRGEALQGDTSYPDLVDYRGSAAFSDIAGYDSRGMIVRIGEESAVLPTAVVTTNYFSLLGVSAFRGRVFTEGEFSSSDAPAEVVVSYRMWQRYLAGDAQAVGQTMLLNNRQYVVIGVLPKKFHSTDPTYAPEVFIPAEVWGRQEMVSRENARFRLVGRLHDSVDIVQARAQMDTVAQQLAAAYPKWRQGRVITVCSQWTCGGGDRKPTARGEVTGGALIVAISLLVLLIAAANVAALMMARSESRRREVATRVAIGASRLRVTRQLLTEGVVLAVAGLLVAMLMAVWIISVLPGLLPAELRGTADFRLDLRAVAFASIVALLSVLVFGLVPALQARRVSLVSDLKEGGAAGTAPARAWARTILIVGQISLSVVLLTSAGLLVRTFINAQRQNLGFDARGKVLMMQIAPWMGKTKGRFGQEYPQLLERIEAIPGVARASFATRAPFSSYGGGARTKIYVPGMQLAPPETGVPMNFDVADGNYFQVLGTRLQRGRTFGTQDQAKSPRVAILNETAARRLWPGADPVGQHFRFGGRDGQDTEVVGVVEDGKYSDIVEEIRPQIFLPFTQGSLGDIMLLVKTRVAPESVLAVVRSEIRNFDSSIAVFEILTLDQHMRIALFAQRVMAQLVLALALLGLALAVVGLYGVLAYYVNQRRHEMGIRIAVGAQPSALFRMIVKRGMLLAAIGVGAGTVGAIAATRLLQGMLYGVSPTDPLTLVAVVVVLAVVALLASLVPARRAMKVDPMTALRYE